MNFCKKIKELFENMAKFIVMLSIYDRRQKMCNILKKAENSMNAVYTAENVYLSESRTMGKGRDVVTAFAIMDSKLKTQSNFAPKENISAKKILPHRINVASIQREQAVKTIG